MSTLDLFKTRPFNTVTLTDPKTQQPIVFKIPNEYLVEEVERLIEIQILRHKLEKTEYDTDDKKAETKHLNEYWRIVFDQLEILFQHYHPEVTGEQLRSMLTHKEALEIIGFYNDNKFQENPQEKTDSKKKI